jgi:hypothetical protein
MTSLNNSKDVGNDKGASPWIREAAGSFFFVFLL